MTTTSRPNREALSKAVDIYRDAMRPFLLRALRRVQGGNVETVIRRSLPEKQAESLTAELTKGSDLESALDVNYFPNLVGNHHNWRQVFSKEFNDDRKIQNALWLITDARNAVSHPGTQDLEDEYTRTHLYHIADVLGKINAPEQRREVEQIRDALVNPPLTLEVQQPIDSGPEDDGPSDTRQAGRNTAGLKPWREVIRPNQDVAQGSYQQAEFMADLQQVYDGRAVSTQYGNPVSFFEHTYITPGIRALLVNAVKRLNGGGGDPVIQTKTGFGGGKTHSLIALFHLVRNAGALLDPQESGDYSVADEIRSIIADGGYDQNSQALGEIAVLDGTYLATTDSRRTEQGDPLNTLWGEMAWQLYGQKGYDIVREAARQGTAPGGAQLDELLNEVGPCVILIDEPVAYIRNAGAAQDNIYTFFQALTQAVRRTHDAILVVTLPQTQTEAGGETGIEVMDRLDSLLGRVEAVWEPLAIYETFEVVRRRLFGPVTDPEAMQRTCEAFARMYSQNRREYPQGVAEQNYLQRLKSCYPIHPEIFDRLYQDWSSIPDFQRTRGVLRMLSTGVNRLDMRKDRGYLIMPADLPLSDEALSHEFDRLLPGNWRPVISEVDSDNSKTDNIDKSSTRFAELGGAARRVARTIFLGSAGSGAIRGIDQRTIHLGTTQPGEGVATYNDALNSMGGELFYLYSDGVRYFFHAEENLNKVANDRIEEFSEREVDDHILDVLEEARNRRGDVILYSGSTWDVPEGDSVRLVVLPPRLSLPTRSAEEDTASPEALKILKERGEAPRTRRNTLLFLTAKRDEIRSLRNEVRKFLAWRSIISGERSIRNLSGERRSQASANGRESETGARAAAVRAYRWALAPVQSDPQRAEYTLNQTQIEARENGEIVAKTLEKLTQEEALVARITPAALNRTLGQYFWNGDDGPSHVSIDYVWDVLTANVYLHRLQDKAVLLRCIEQGVEEGAFGYARDYVGESYQGLRYTGALADAGPLVAERNIGFLVKPAVAARQQAAERAAPPSDDSPGGVTDEPDGPYRDKPGPDGPPPLRGPRRITARKTAGADISLDDINLLRQEIIRNLSTDGGEVTVEITVSARKDDGFSENITRSVRENSIQLGLQFDEEA